MVSILGNYHQQHLRLLCGANRSARYIIANRRHRAFVFVILGVVDKTSKIKTHSNLRIDMHLDWCVVGRAVCQKR